MTAAEKAVSRVGSVGEVVTITGTPLKAGVYTVTVATQSDWVILSDFSEVKFATATIDASGAINGCTIDGTTTNKVLLNSATTGAATILAFGI
jgi:hypothetical protein